MSHGFLAFFWIGCWISWLGLVRFVTWWSEGLCSLIVPQLDLLFQFLLQKAVMILEGLTKKHVFCLFSTVCWHLDFFSAIQGKQAFLWSFYKGPSSPPFPGFLRRHCSLQLEDFPFTSCALGAVGLTGLSPNWILPSSFMRWLIMFILNVAMLWITHIQVSPHFPVTGLWTNDFGLLGLSLCWLPCRLFAWGIAAICSAGMSAILCLLCCFLAVRCSAAAVSSPGKTSVPFPFQMQYWNP